MLGPGATAEATLPELTRTQHSQSYGVSSPNAKSKCAAPLIPAGRDPSLLAFLA